MTVSQHAQYQDPEIRAAKWNSAIINVIIHTCNFPAESQNLDLKGYVTDFPWRKCFRISAI